MYPNAPVVLVALEVRHPASGLLSSRDRARLKSELGRRTPIRRDVRSYGFEIGAGGPLIPRAMEEEFPKYFDRSQTIAVSAQSEATVIELSAYRGWEDCVDLVRLVMESRNRVAPIDGTLRVGLRFINEFRVPGESPDWSGYLNAPIKPDGLAVPDMKMQGWQGTSVYQHEHTAGQMLNLRYGLMEESTIAAGGHDLRFPNRGRGTFYLLDMDSYLTPVGTPEFVLEDLIETMERLHAPLRQLFERLITDRLRDEVLRNGVASGE